MIRMSVNRILPLLLLLVFFTSCARKYKVEGSSSVTSIRGTQPVHIAGRDTTEKARQLRRYREGQELALFLNNQKNSPAEVQMQRRLEGFMQYLAAEHKNLTIHDVVLHKEDTAANEEVLDAFFSGHPKATLGVVFNSRVYQVADYLQKKNLKLDALVGYDLLQKNVEHLKNGEVNYLIGQRPGLQGYCGIKALCNHVVFKKPVTAVKYMPIDILMKENIDFYFEFE